MLLWTIRCLQYKVSETTRIKLTLHTAKPVLCWIRAVWPRDIFTRFRCAQDGTDNARAYRECGGWRPAATNSVTRTCTALWISLRTLFCPQRNLYIRLARSSIPIFNNSCLHYIDNVEIISIKFDPNYTSSIEKSIVASYVTLWEIWKALWKAQKIKRIRCSGSSLSRSIARNLDESVHLS